MRKREEEKHAEDRRENKIQRRFVYIYHAISTPIHVLKVWSFIFKQTLNYSLPIQLQRMTI